MRIFNNTFIMYEIQHQGYKEYGEGNLTLYEHSEGFWTVADNEVAIPGIYESREVATKAANMGMEIYDIVKACEPRVITMEDITL